MAEHLDCACTLFEGDYHHGVAALANSLHLNGFRGTLYVGYKGKLPAWARSASDDGLLALAPGLTVNFIKLATSWHLTNYKPRFMLDLLQKQAVDVRSIAYFDPDIVVTCRWDFFRKWFDEGVCVVQEITNGDMPSTHPIRLAWTRFLKAHGYGIENLIERYFNAGFIAVPMRSREFLEVWHHLIQEILQEQQEKKGTFMQGDRSDPFYAPDQDCLNAALMATSQPISAIGPEGMGFTYGGFTMQHAVGSPKPWRFSLQKSILYARPPSMAAKAFLLYTEGPIISMSWLRRRWLRIAMRIASLVGRFYSRT